MTDGPRYPHSPPGHRGVGLRTEPTISVVIASARSVELLDSCLASIRPQATPLGAEIVVARSGSEAERLELERRYPDVRFATAPPEARIPELRAAGLAAAQGDVVALTEDHCVVSESWLAQLVQASRAGADVVGGAMDNARQRRAVDWAAYFAEYGFFAGDASRSGGEPMVTAANVAYRRGVIAEVIALARAGEWENVVHRQLRARGSTFAFLRSAAVCQNDSYGFWEFWRDRYAHGRSYARRRLVDERGRRWLLFFGSAALPFLLTSRVARAAGRRRPLAFLRALPVTFVFLTAWALGEARGYWLGPAPDGPGAS